MAFPEGRPGWNPVRPEEASNRWWPLSELESEHVLINVDTGRVFSECELEFALAAESLSDYLTKYLENLRTGRLVHRSGTEGEDVELEEAAPSS